MCLIKERPLRWVRRSLAIGINIIMDHLVSYCWKKVVHPYSLYQRRAVVGVRVAGFSMSSNMKSHTSSGKKYIGLGAPRALDVEQFEIITDMI